jgi:hypothetical protein
MRYEVLYASFVAPLSFQMREECQYYLTVSMN